jgi:alpha-galactosidase
MADTDATRQPLIFYNTWNYQERLFNWHKRPYLSEMNQDRMLAEIDAAARMGVEVFVIDTGWYARTGDWRVEPTASPTA